MSSEIAIATNLARVERAHEWIADKTERAQEIIALLRADDVTNDTKHNELHNLRGECLYLFCVDGLIIIPYDKKRFFSRSCNVFQPDEIVLRESIETLKIITNGRYNALSLEVFLAAYRNNPYLAPPTARWTAEQWRNAIPTWASLSEALIRGTEIAAIVCGTLGIPWKKSWEQYSVVQKYSCAHRNEKIPSALISDFYALGGEEKLTALYDDGIPFEDVFGA